MATDELKTLRINIDSVDDEILRLLNVRSKLVLEVGEIKRQSSGKLKYHSPLRENQIVKRLKELNTGPFPSDAIRSVYREIMSASLSLENPLTISCLGPLGTFTHLAGLRHFGSSSVFLPVNGIKEVFDKVDRKEAEYGIVPIENSNEGVISYTLDMFMDYDLKVNAEVMLEVSHNLISQTGRKSKVKKIYSHPQALSQCRNWLETNMKRVSVYEASSTAKAAEMAAKNETIAAIASEAAAKLYNLKTIQSRIEDNRNNYTRFLVISRDFPPMTGTDKTSIMFSIKDRPGALYSILEPFKKGGINMTKIESRPSRRKAWEYIFFVDMTGHIEEKKIQKAVEDITRECLFLKVLGSYPAGE